MSVLTSPRIKDETITASEKVKTHVITRAGFDTSVAGGQYADRGDGGRN